MKLDVKLDHFYKSVIDDATAQSISILADYRAQLNQLYQERNKALLQNQVHTLKDYKDNMAKEKNKQLSSEALLIRRKISEKKKSLKDTLFADVTAQVAAFMKTKAYEELLVTLITSALDFANGDSLTIYINSSDATLKEQLENRTGATLTVSTIDFIGGIRAVLHERHILIDHSFITKISEEKEQFQF